MQRLQTRISDLEKRFERLSADGQDSLQTIANWALATAEKDKQSFSTTTTIPTPTSSALRDWKLPETAVDDDYDGSDAIKMVAARANMLAVVKLLKAIIVEMRATVDSYVAEFSHVMERDADIRRKIHNFKAKVTAYSNEMLLKEAISSHVFCLQEEHDASVKAMVYLSCWMHLPFVTDEKKDQEG
ncbi:hypothetical protein HK100_008160, partial [Physocladia obscura]